MSYNNHHATKYKAEKKELYLGHSPMNKKRKAQKSRNDKNLAGKDFTKIWEKRK
jgi:hypothetical protein